MNCEKQDGLNTKTRKHSNAKTEAIGVVYGGLMLFWVFSVFLENGPRVIFASCKNSRRRPLLVDQKRERYS